MKELLALRKKIKKRKPEFIRQDAHKKSLGRKWRRPKGIDSKIRLGLHGYRKAVTPGYGSPRKVKHLHPSGLMPVRVFSLKDLEGIDKEKQGLILAKTIGTRKRIGLVKEIMKKGFSILNMKNPQEFITKVEENRKHQKEEKKKQKEEKKKKEEKAKEKKEDKGLAEKVMTEEEKTNEEKKEKNRILTKKDARM